VLSLAVKLGGPLTARKLRLDAKDYPLVAAGDFPHGAGNIIQKVVLDPTGNKVVGHSHPEIIISKSKPGRVFEPDPVLLLPDSVRKCLIYGTNFVRERGLHFQPPNLSISTKKLFDPSI